MKRLIGKLIDKYAEYDPRIYIKTYYEKERRKKSKYFKKQSNIYSIIK